MEPVGSAVGEQVGDAERVVVALDVHPVVGKRRRSAKLRLHVRSNWSLPMKIKRQLVGELGAGSSRVDAGRVMIVVNDDIVTVVDGDDENQHFCVPPADTF